MSPTATDVSKEKSSKPAAARPRFPLAGPAMELRPKPGPVPVTVSPAAEKTSSPAKAASPAPSISPAAPAPAPSTHVEVLALHSTYGNAAVTRAALSASAVAPAPPAGTTDPKLSPSHDHAASVPTTYAASDHQAATTSTATASTAAVPSAKAPEKTEPGKSPAPTPAPGKPHSPPSGAHAVVATGSKPAATGAKSTAAHPPATAKPEASKPAAHKGAAHETAAHEKASRAAAREAIAPVAHAIHHRAATARKHSPAATPIASADAAGTTPSTEQTRTAAVQSVGNLAAAKTAPVKRNDFKDKLKEAIKKATPQPKTESEADDVMKSGGAKASNTLRDQLSTQRDEAAGSLKSAASPEGDVAPSSQPAPPKENLTPEPLGAPPAPVAAAGAVPAPLPAQQLDYSSDRDATDHAMAESGVTKEQLAEGNEPEFKQNLDSRSEAEKHEASVEGRYRKSEAGVRGQAEHAAHAEISGGLAAVHGARALQIAKVVGQQLTTTSKHAAERQQVTDKINSIKNETRAKVEEILASMETEASKIFEAGLARAEDAYKQTFEDAKGGIGTWLTTWGDDWRQLIEDSLAKAREEYLRQVDIAIDEVANLVDAKLEAAKQRVEQGRRDVETYVKTLDKNLAHFGADALRSVQADFDQMSGEIDQRRDALVEKIAQEYKASYDRMSAMEEKLREENKSLWDRIYDATVGLIKKILAFKDMLLNVLARAADAIGTIIAHPINFLGNLVDAGKLGFSNFVDHILDHLKQGFMEWLFGAVAETGIQLPKNFDLQGILSLVLQILGLTYSNIRSRAVKILGEKVVKALETAAEIFKILVTKGPAGLWEYIKEKIGDLKAMVIEKIKAFVMEKIIMAGVTWLIGLLNPASAFFKACKAIYDIVMFFIERGKQILDLVNAIIDSITSIAKGAIGAAANFVEASLARTIPVIIGFLAALLGVGGITDKIKEIIEAIRKPINEAIDWVITKAVDLVKAVGSLLGFGKEEKKDESDDPEHKMKVQAGLQALGDEEKSVSKDGKISREQAEQVAAKVKKEHPVFKSIMVVDGKGTWNFRYVGSEGEVDGLPQEEGENVVDEEVLVNEIVQGLKIRGGETHLTEVSIEGSRTNIRGIFATEGVPSSAMSVIDNLLDAAVNTTTGDEITKLMAEVSGAVNEELKNAGSSVRVNAHHINRVSQEVPTFINTKRARLYLRKKYRDSIERWVKDNAHLAADVVAERRREIVSLLRDELLDDRLTSVERPLEEVDMVVGTSGKHRQLHAMEQRQEEP
jgi:hypothetical protein